MVERISAARLSKLIGLIYDCAIEPARWPIAMEAIRQELDFHNATLDLILLPSGHSLTNVICNVPEEYESLIQDAGPDVVEQWGGAEAIQALPLDRPAVLSHVNPAFDPATSTNAYYSAFARPQGIIDAMAIGLARDAGAIGTVSFGRHASAGPIGDREIETAHLLIPHLQRAATINRMLEGAALAEAGLGATLDGLSVPIVLLDAERQLLHANTRAQDAIERQRLIRLVDGRVEATTMGATIAMTAAVAQAAQDESTIGRRGLGIPVIEPRGSNGALHLLPLRRRHTRFGGGAVAALFVADVDAPFVPPTDMAAALFDFTPAEARVFELIVVGHTQNAIAETLRVERSTVKTHLARLYDKVGVRRQVDLVRVATSLTIPAGGITF